MKNSSIKIQFLGIAGKVTNSNYLISAYGKNILFDSGAEKVITYNTIQHESNRIDLSDIFISVFNNQ